MSETTPKPFEPAQEAIEKVAFEMFDHLLAGAGECGPISARQLGILCECSERTIMRKRAAKDPAVIRLEHADAVFLLKEHIQETANTIREAADDIRRASPDLAREVHAIAARLLTFLEDAPSATWRWRAREMLNEERYEQKHGERDRLKRLGF